MSIRCGFFNSINHDRKYTSEDISEMFNGLFSDGIFPDAVIQDGYEDNDKFAVTVNEGFHLIVGTGKAWFNKIWILNDSKTGVLIPEPHLILSRIDAVVLQIDKSEGARDVQIIVVHGIPAANPVKPILKLNTEEKFYQYALAYVTVPANASSIVQSNIENVVGTNETPYALYLGQSAADIKVTNRLDITEPGYLLDATRGKYFNDRIPFGFGIDSNGKYGYIKDGVLIPFFDGQAIDLGVGTRFDLSGYQGYRNFTVNKNFFATVHRISLVDSALQASCDILATIGPEDVPHTDYFVEESLSGSGPVPILSYNSDTGILTVGNLTSNQISKQVTAYPADADGYAGIANVWITIQVSCRVFLVY